MANTTKPLTNTEIKQAKSKKKEYNLADGEGLALRIKPNGKKYWIFNYSQPYTKKRKNLSFGAYPDLSLANARLKRLAVRNLLAQNIDPKEYKDQQDQKECIERNNTLEHIASQWFEVKKNEITPNYADDIWGSFKLHIFPPLGKMPLNTLSAPKVISTLKPVAAKGNLETVKRLCQRLNEVFVWSVNTGLIEVNPLAGIGKAFNAPKKQHMPTLKPEELPDLMRTLTLASIRITTRCLIEWQLHTMVRPSEAAGTRWEEIDLKTKLWTIPAERMKKRRGHVVPLSDQCLGLLDVMKPISHHREFVFPADREPRKHANSSTANVALKRMGFDGRLVAHGMRALASTTLNEQGFDPDVIESALAHVDKNEVRRAYNRADYLERRRVMMNWWSEHIEQAATGNMSLANSKVALRAVG